MKTTVPGHGVATHRCTEQASLSMRHPEMDAAIERFQSHPDMALRLSLARELAQTRCHEFTLAYRNVVAVVAGWRRKRAFGGAPQPLLREPCVVLVVKKKWKTGEAPTDARQTLPRHLLVGAEVAGVRHLFAVPTDVQLAKTFLDGRAYGSSAVRVDDPARPDFGTLTCAVHLTRADAGPPETMVLSAMHVFTPFAEVQAGPSTTPAKVRPAPHPDNPAIGSTTMLRGRLAWSDPGSADHNFSFDAQLAAVGQVPWLRQQLVDMPLSAAAPWVDGPETLDRLNAQGCNFLLHAADNHPDHGPVQIGLTHLTTDLSAIPLEYTLRASGIGQSADPLAPLATVVIYHWELLQFDVAGPDAPQPGDSGAPVLARLPDGSLTLVGMFVAGTPEFRKAYVLPAWQLFYPPNWGEDQVQSIRPINLPS